jgi:hypothetical protein
MQMTLLVILHGLLILAGALVWLAELGLDVSTFRGQIDSTRPGQCCLP